MTGQESATVLTTMRKIKVLVVDDSLVFREIVVRGLAHDSQIEVVATAVDPYDARDKILAYRPDVMTCDIEMPKMNGIEFIRRLLPQYPLPVIVISTTSGAVFDALNAGAVEFISKPDLSSHRHIQRFLVDLAEKIKIAANSKIKVAGTSRRVVQPQNRPGTSSYRRQVIAIGSSTGGTEALHYLLSHLPADLPAILIAQHIPPVFSRLFAERLDAQTAFTVKEAESGDVLEAGKVFVAPGDRHLRLKRQAGRYLAELVDSEKVNGHRPSVDVLFESVAEAAGDKAVGIILTGMGADGARGLLSMRRKGARTIGQDEQSSVVYGMPKVAYEIGAVEKQAPLSEIPDLLLEALSR